MRSFALGTVALSLIACAASSTDADSSAQDQTTASSFTDGESLTYEQLATLAHPSDMSAAIIFPSSGDPEVLGNLVAGGKVTVVYALNRLSQCRGSHDGFPIWDTRIGGELSNGTKVGEELGNGANGQAPGSVKSFAGGSATGPALVTPFTFDVPAGAETLALYAHNTSPAGPSPACDTYDSKSSANFQFRVAGDPNGITDGSHADAAALASLVDIGDGSDAAEILFGSSGTPVVKGKLVQGGKVMIAVALDRLPQCRASHDGYPFWVTQVGGTFSDGTKVGEATRSGSFFDSAESQPGHVVRFVPVAHEEWPVAESTPTVFQIPETATDVALWVHNWNPGGPVEPCSAFDSLNGANYHFSVQSR